jgi:hypothetical protein
MLMERRAFLAMLSGSVLGECRHRPHRRRGFERTWSGEIKLRKIDGWRKIAAMLSQHTAVAA